LLLHLSLGQPSPPSTLLITLTGIAGLALTGAGTLVFTAPAPGVPAGTAALSGTSPFILSISFTAGFFTGGNVTTFTIPGFTNPANAQNAIINAAATTANDCTTIVGSSIEGTYPKIFSAMLMSTSITVAVTTAGASVAPVLVLTPTTTVPIAGTITLTLPAGYFLGSVTSITAAAGLAATSTPAATAASTTIILTKVAPPPALPLSR